MTNVDLFSIESLELQDIESDTTNSCYNFPCKHLRDDESNYPPGSEEYKKARKRRQNRESAVRIRAKKKLEECKVITSLEVLKESTGKLKGENAKLRSENETLRKQIAMLKTLASEKKEEPKAKPKGKGLAMAGLLASLVCISVVMREEKSQGPDGGGKKLLEVKEDFQIKPVIIAILVIVCGFCLSFLKNG